MATVNNYRFRCVTEDADVYVWSETLPTLCPNNSAHTINADSITIVGVLDAEDVHVTNDPNIVIKQERKTTGHYKILPLLLSNVPAGETRYVDRVIPDLTRGLDWLSSLFDGGDQVETGDLVCAGKLLFGQIAQIAADAAQGDIIVQIAGPVAFLKDTSEGGALSEGFFLSFGTENTTAAGINAGPPSISGNRSWANPDQELREYEVKRFSAQTPIGGGNCVVTLTLFTALEVAITAGTPVNLVSSAIPEPLTMLKGERLDVGGQSFVSGPMPAGAKVRAGFRNNGASSKTICGKLFVLFGGS